MQVSNTFLHWKFYRSPSYVTKEEKGKLIRMDLGEFLGVPRAVPYPDPCQHTLKQMLADRWKIDLDMITLGVGSDELIERIPQVFLNPKQRVLVTAPTFFRFSDASLRIGGLVETIFLKREKQFAFDNAWVDQVLCAAKKRHIRIIWLCSPNNPTGVIIANEHIARICRETKTLVILDSVFLGINEQIVEQTKLIKRFLNLLVLRSFSKIDGFAGIRVGVAIGNKSMITPLEAWRLPFAIPTSSLLVAQQHLQTLRYAHNSTLFEPERTRLFEAIDNLPSFEIGARSQTSIFLLRHKTRDLFDLLLQRGIKTADFRNTTGLKRMGFVRITIQTPFTNAKLIEALMDIQKMS